MVLTSIKNLILQTDLQSVDVAAVHVVPEPDADPAGILRSYQRGFVPGHLALSRSKVHLHVHVVALFLFCLKQIFMKI